MGVLFNARHERFAQFVAKGMKPPKAYMAAGYDVSNIKAATSAASRLMADEDIKARIVEINSKGAVRAEKGRAEIIAKLWELSEKAEGLKQMASAIRAIELAGKDQGMFVDRKEIKTTALDDMTDEKLAILERELQQSIILERTREAISSDTEAAPRK